MHELDPLLVNANRIESYENASLSVTQFGPEELESLKYRDINEAIRSAPSIATYRRTQPSSAHPSTQGVRFRNTAANATSRALVVYNGVPQNDPFGAWVYWHQFDLSQIELVSIYPGGSAEQWGNMAAGGVISLLAEGAAPGSSEIQASIGTADRYELQANSATSLSDSVVVDFGLRRFSTDGFSTVREDQRGLVDETANSDSTSGQIRLSWDSGHLWNSQFIVRGMQERRSNGTALARNETDLLDLSYISERRFDASDARLNISLYFQDRQFRNVFTSVAEDRASERPALDQYDVPASSYGGAIAYRQDTVSPWSFDLGVDYRFIEGTINERFRNLGDGFTRDRHAGGKQLFAGGFIKSQFTLSEKDTLSATFRLDQAKQFDGVRIETDTVANEVLLDETFEDRKSNPLSGNLSWRHQFADTTSSQLSLFSGFRAPTLNELYRPYRVRNDITEANPNLTDETVRGIDYTISYSPSNRNELRFTGFAYEIEDMVANVRVTTEAGFDPRFGFIPEGGSGSLRANLNRTSVSGFELHSTRDFTDTFRFNLAATYTQTRVESDEYTQLEGMEFPQSPPWRIVAGFDWQPSEILQLWSRYIWADRSFEDLGNQIKIGTSSELSLGARYQIDNSRSLSFTVSNLLDTENVVGISSAGLVSVDEPREFLLTFSWRR